MPNILWTPQPRQAIFMARGEWEALYGGAAGGGKSEALIMEALRQVHIPHYKALIYTMIVGFYFGTQSMKGETTS